MDDYVIRFSSPERGKADAETLFSHEWLVTNGLGGYASGTLAGVATRRYHALLVSALATPLGRRIMFNHLSEMIRLPDRTTVILGSAERQGQPVCAGMEYLEEFRLEAGLPVWRYTFQGAAVEKRLFMVHEQNTVHINYRLVAGTGPIRLKLMPSLHFRKHEDPVSSGEAGPYRLSYAEQKYEIADDGPPPPLRFYLRGERAAFTIDPKKFDNILYRMEESRGYEFTGNLWSPGYFRVDLAADRDATLVASTEPWNVVLALNPKAGYEAEHERRMRLFASARAEIREPRTRELILAADQFIITPLGRVEDTARARAAGDQICSVIAGYHWFTDWGRDTMISLEGLTLATGRHAEAGWILRTFAHYIRDGLIPNMFPEGERQGLYHTADATLWFFHALARYLLYTDDRITLRLLLPELESIIDHHLKGTRFGIGADPADGLLRQGAEGYQLTWMDAKVGDWVVTPRRGKAVEINALWYNALRLLEGWLREERGDEAAKPIGERADRVRESFNERFWNAERGYLYDVVDGEHGNDPDCRPNQLFALSLPHPVLDRAHWSQVLDVVTNHLLTPMGLRSLAPGEPEYKSRYYGDLRARDAAYHQGTVWAWLIGPFVDAWMRVHPDDRIGARQFLEHLLDDHLAEACVGSISEIFDAEPPYMARGCIAQAWSVAEVLRAWVATAPEAVPEAVKP